MLCHERASTVNAAFALSVCQVFQFYTDYHILLRVMTIKTYKELFHYTTFPVFATLRDTGEVIYKNFSCEKYLPKLSKRNLVTPFVFAQKFSGVGAVVLAEPSPYQTAIALEDGKYSVFLFLSHLQAEDGICLAAKQFQEFGPSLTDFLAAVHCGNSFKTRGSVLSETNVSLYTEVGQIQLDENDLEGYIPVPLCSLMTTVFEKLRSVFADFGYCVHAQIEEDFPYYLQTDVDFRDILFVLGRLMYLQMKLSKNKEVNVFFACDLAYSRHIFNMKAETNLVGLNHPSEDLMDWLLSFIPECKMEFSLLFKARLLTKDNFVAKVDKFGNLTLQYSIPYKSIDTYYVRSVDMPDIFLLNAVDNMIENLFVKLTGNTESC